MEEGNPNMDRGQHFEKPTSPDLTPITELASLPRGQCDMALTRRGRRARLPDNEETQDGNSTGIHAPLDLLESIGRICSMTQAIEVVILLRLADGLSI
jgi:hypothetical protein